MQTEGTMAEYFAKPKTHCTTCGHWGRSVHSPETPCMATGGNPGFCGCTDTAGTVLDTPEDFQVRYHLS